jgi:stage III sporulation protein AG
MNKFSTLWQKIKSIKHIHIYAALALGLVICVVYFSNFKKSSSSSETEISTENYSTATEYVNYLENKLSNVLSKISGAGSVNVIITLENGFSYVYATDTETKTIVSNGTETTLTTETVILVSNEPVVVKEIYPNIKGVVVVAEGAADVSVKLNILTAVETVLEIDRNNITVLT